MSIHKKRRKVEICHNCHTVLSVETNFCPHCGQENHDLKVPLGHLAFEVFEGFTHFDTKFYNTMKAIFLTPGKITKDFLEGRRGRYVPPVRLYFSVAFVFFLALDKMIDNAVSAKDNFFEGMIEGLSGTKVVSVATPDTKKIQKNIKIEQEKIDRYEDSDDTTGLFAAQNRLRKLQKESDSTRVSTKRKIANDFVGYANISADAVIDEMNIQYNDTLRKLIEKLPENQQREILISIQKQIITDTLNTEEIEEPSNDLRNYFTETIGKKRQLLYTLIPHAVKNNSIIKIKYDGDTLINIKGSDGSLENVAYKKRILKMSDAELDSILVKNKKADFMGIKSLSRGLLRNSTYYDLAFSDDGVKAFSEVAHLGVGAFSLMMFFLMPIVAFLLKIIYSKRTHSIISYPFRLLKYMWDWAMYLVRFRKTRRYRHVPHLMAGQTRYYYEHLIFSIHIHAIFFLMILIFVGGGMAIGFPGSTLAITMLGFFLYFIISLKTVYRQGILKTLLKSVILFFMYSMTFMMVLIFTGAFKFAMA
ncbi:MAG: DUF3667 domain-containing protein [Arcicella sp.]|nr:DUF3667 domain-containing protein [Arcicella sp.]